MYIHVYKFKTKHTHILKRFVYAFNVCVVLDDVGRLWVPWNSSGFSGVYFTVFGAKYPFYTRNHSFLFCFCVSVLFENSKSVSGGILFVE